MILSKTKRGNFAYVCSYKGHAYSKNSFYADKKGDIPEHKSGALRSSNLRSSDFVISWLGEIFKNFKPIPILDPTSEFLEMAEAMFFDCKLGTY